MDRMIKYCQGYIGYNQRFMQKQTDPWAIEYQQLRLSEEVYAVRYSPGLASEFFEDTVELYYSNLKLVIKIVKKLQQLLII